MNTVYVLLMLYWGGSGSGQGFMASAEFNSAQACSAAGELANHKFNSTFGRSFYYVCAPK